MRDHDIIRKLDDFLKNETDDSKNVKIKSTIPIKDLPQDWRIVKLTEVAEYINGYPFSVKDWKRSGLPIIRIQNLNDPNAEFNYFDGEIDKKYIVNDGDILLSWSGSVGVYMWNRGKAVLNQHIFKVVPKHFVDRKFLYYAIFLAIQQLKKRVHGSTMKHFKKRELSNTYILLPPIGEQRRIAEVLSTVDEAIRLVDESIAGTERLKKGLMQELLTKGIGHKEFKDTEIGRIPKEWEVKKLGELTDLQSGQYFKYSEFRNSGVRCFKIDNVGFGEILWKTTTFLPRDYIKKYPELVLNPGDIVIALNRPIINGKIKVGMLREEDCPSILYQRVGRIVLKNKEKLDKKFLFFVLMGEHFKRQLHRSLIGTDQPYVRTPSFLRIRIALPPLNEQKKIAEILSTIDKKFGTERKRKKKLEQIKNALMDLLLTGKVRVKI